MGKGKNQVSEYTRANRNDIAVREIITNIVPVHEIVINIVPVHENFKTHYCSFFFFLYSLLCSLLMYTRIMKIY